VELTCKNTISPESVVLDVSLFELTINSEDHKNPTKLTNRNLYVKWLDSKTRFLDNFAIQRKNFYDDVGWLTESYEKNPLIGLREEFISQVTTRGTHNIMNNYIINGKVIMADFYAGWAFKTSDIVTNVKRTYFNFLSVLAAVGGLLGFITMGVTSFYFYYN